MSDIKNNFEDTAYTPDEELLYKQTKSVPKPKLNIGIDTDKKVYDNLMGGNASTIDFSVLESFLSISQSRDTIYSLLDAMSEDTTISAVLEIYAEDATEENDDGRIVFCQSDDDKVYKYITFLLDSLNIDKKIYQWAYSLVKYGDVYIRLYRKSEVEEEEKKEKLDENLRVVGYSPNDKYSHYVEMHPNPAEIFELTKFGKTYSYIQAPTATPIKTDTLYNAYYRYSFRKEDVFLFDPTCFVHACLLDNSSRTPEEVELFGDDSSTDGSQPVTQKFTVRRGQSILYNSFKIWREMMLLENALLLNRITKSSIARIIGVEVGDMPKEEVPNKLMSVKQLFEQKAALNTNQSMAEYTNPGPVENNVYVPTHGGIGNISIQQVGGDVDVKGLTDVDFFKTKLYSGLRVPKQFLGDTDDATGFNGGTSLSIISSRYAKAIKRVQNTLTQAITDMINLMLIDRHMESYINKFSIKMIPPITQEELDRREATQNRISTIGDIMNLVSDIEDMSAKFRILKSLISEVVQNEELNAVLEEQIEALQEQEEGGEDTTPSGSDNDFESFDGGGGGGNDFDIDFNGGGGGEDFESEPTEEASTEETLPTPSDLGAGDFTDANLEI